MIKKLPLSLAIASGLGLFTQHAMAANQDINLRAGGTQTPAIFASELPANQQTLALAGSNKFHVRVPVPTYPIDANNPFYIKFSLVGGSQFKDLSTNASFACAAEVSVLQQVLTSVLAAKTLVDTTMGTNALTSAVGTIGKIVADAVDATFATVAQAAEIKAMTAAILKATTLAETNVLALEPAIAAPDDGSLFKDSYPDATTVNVSTLKTAATLAKDNAKKLDVAADALVGTPANINTFETAFNAAINSAVSTTFIDTDDTNTKLSVLTARPIVDAEIGTISVGGADGQQSVTYQIKEPVAGKINLTSNKTSTYTNVKGDAGNSAGCLFTFGVVTGMSGNMVNQNISATVQYKDGNNPVSASYAAPFITFAQAAAVKYDKGTNVAVVDVSEGSKLFTTGSTLDPSTASLGTVTYQAATTAPFNAVGVAYVAANAISDATLTIKGPALGAVAIPTVSGDVNNGKIYLTTAAADCDTAAGSNLVDSAKQVGASGTVSFSLTPAQATKGVDVCMLVDGEHDIAKGQITAELTATPNGSARPVLSLDNNNLVEVTKNGASVKVLNIPTATGIDKPFIRINNMGNQTGKVFGTLYNQADGAVLGTANAELGNLTPYQTVVLNADALASIFGVSTWAGRAWMQIDAELSDIAVQGLVRTPAGVLSNLSSGGDKAN